jgi:uncharacterized membrane protein
MYFADPNRGRRRRATARDRVIAGWHDVANFENFPKFMTHRKEVRHLKNGRSHWVAAGPCGVSIPWVVEITEQRANQLLAWTSVPGSMVGTAGVVRSDPEPDDSTRVQIRMSYCRPAGLFGHTVAWVFGADPKTEMDEDLVRLKSLLETGKTPCAWSGDCGRAGGDRAN